MNYSLLHDIELLEQKMITRRRYLHQYPELSGQEKETMRYICAQLEEIGVSYHSGIAGTGVVAEIGPAKQGERVLALRADMDALPIQEESGVTFASCKPGVMHACGHDMHTAILLTVCEYLQKNREKLKGMVKFIFQPLEETSGGAEPMIAAGVLNNPAVTACAALHVDPELDCGKIRVKSGTVYASPDDFEIVIHGKSGHGAQPELCIDPVLIAAQVICALQSIVSRKLDPLDSAVITVGAVHGGTCSNAIPESVTLVGTARAATDEMRIFLEKEIERVTAGICSASGATYEYRFIKLFPPLVNDESIAQQLHRSAVRVVGNENALWGGNATMAGEDFSYFTQMIPGAIFKLGCRNENIGYSAPLHNARFNPAESCMKYGAAVLADFALSFLDTVKCEKE